MKDLSGLLEAECNTEPDYQEQEECRPILPGDIIELQIGDEVVEVQLCSYVASDANLDILRRLAAVDIPVAEEHREVYERHYRGLKEDGIDIFSSYACWLFLKRKAALDGIAKENEELISQASQVA
jgi:hypothetical protein